MRQTLLALLVVLAVVVTSVVVRALVHRAATDSADASALERQTYPGGNGWTVVVDRKDGFGCADFEVRLGNTVLPVNEVTLVPWGTAFVENVAWQDANEVRVRGLRRDPQQVFLGSWNGITVRYDLR